MLSRPKKKELSVEERKAITLASSRQTGELKSPKTYDSAYPLFDIPTNGKVLVYIPNHVETLEDGTVSLVKDVYAAHNVRIGKAYTRVRCSGGIVNEALGFDGYCPICDAMSTAWDYYNIQFTETALARGLDPKAPETKEAIKEDMKEALREMVVKKAERYYTFPIVVVECEEGKTVPKRDAEGKITGTPMFYTTSEVSYNDKWLSAFDAIEDDNGDNNPAGRWAVLNYTYTPKTGNHNKRDSARNLKVTFKTMPEEYSSWCKYFDELTAEWTPEKAQDVLVQNVIRDMGEMEEVAEEIIKPIRDKVNMYNMTNGSQTAPQGQPTISSAENALGKFGATQVVEQPEVMPTGEMPSIGVQ